VVSENPSGGRPLFILARQVKSSGQECPLHTGNGKGNVKSMQWLASTVIETAHCST
jgi:hypothetical protein